jgi:hypothetical protein
MSGEIISHNHLYNAFDKRSDDDLIFDQFSPKKPFFLFLHFHEQIQDEITAHPGHHTP